jgi:hypothetical protein
VSTTKLPRDEKKTVTLNLCKRLEDRATAGPPEPGLDAFVAELKTLGTNLGDHVTGKVVEDTRRRAALANLDEADDDVDTYFRNHFYFLVAASLRRTGLWAAKAKAILAAAFPDGLETIDDFVPTENRYCRKAITVLETDDNADALKGIALPPEWTRDWIAALDRSDTAWKEAQEAREAFRAHVSDGIDAEADFVEVVGRLRKYIGSRATERKNKARYEEGLKLLAPLTEALDKAERERSARETRRDNKAKKGTAKPATTTPATSAPPAPAATTPATPAAPADPSTKPG